MQVRQMGWIKGREKKKSRPCIGALQGASACDPESYANIKKDIHTLEVAPPLNSGKEQRESQPANVTKQHFRLVHKGCFFFVPSEIIKEKKK